MEHLWPIVAGRWQPFHNGHLWLAKRLIDEYGQLILSVVNPDPSNPPDGQYDRFWPTANPFSYWDRHYMINRVLAREGLIDVVRIVPAWHPRVRMDCEYHCLPPRAQRVWIVPLTSDEEEKKAQDFRDHDEDVVVLADIPQDILKYSAVRIRQLILSGSDQWQNQVPDAILDIAQQIQFEEKIRAAYELRR